MIIHCSKNLASKFSGVSLTPLNEDSPLGSWHGHLFTLDQRQCVILCHDASRYCLFLPGLRKEDFTDLGGKWFRPLFRATLEEIGCSNAKARRAELVTGPIRFDTVTDRSVQGSINIARRDMEFFDYRTERVMDIDPIAAATWLNGRPSSVRGEYLWPKDEMLKTIDRLM